MTLAFNILLLLVFITYVFYILKKDFKTVYIFGLFLFQAITIIPSLIYIESGIFISEQGRESFFVGATFLFVLYFIITFKLIFATFSSLRKFKATNPILKFKNKQYDNTIILYIIIFSLIILLTNAFQSRLPLFDSEITRFTYWSNSKYPFLNKIFGNTSIFIPFAAGILYKNKKFVSVSLLILYFVYNFLIGQKFSPIVSGLFSFFLPILLMSSKTINIRNFLNKKIIISSILLFGLVYFVIYKRYEQRRPFAIIKIYDPNEAMFYRVFGLQGHLMWGASETFVYNDAPHSYRFSDFSKGMQKLMYQFGVQKNGFERSIENGFNFTNGYPSILMYVYPLSIALLLHIFLCICLIAFPGWLLSQFIKNGAYVAALVLYQFFNWVIYAFTMGYFYKLRFMIVFLFCYAVFVIYNNKIKLNRTKKVENE
jgi:hypothetical protein